MDCREIKENSAVALGKILEYISDDVLADSNVVFDAIRIKAYDEIICSICNSLIASEDNENETALDIARCLQELQQDLLEEFENLIKNGNKIGVENEPLI